MMDPIIVEFEETNPNFSVQPMQNRMFVKTQENFANDLLRAKGYLTANDVLESLGLDGTEQGALAGWTRRGFVTFELKGNNLDKDSFEISLNPNTDNVFRDR